MISDKSANAIIVVVTAVWAGNIVAGMIPFLDHEPSEAINGIFMAIVGVAFAARAKRNGNGSDPE